MTSFLLALYVVLLTSCAVLYTVFAVRYSRLRWRRTREGRHLMGQSRVLAVILWATLALVVLPVPLWLAAPLSVALMAWLAFEGTRRNHLLTVNQREARDIAERAREEYRGT